MARRAGHRPSRRHPIVDVGSLVLAWFLPLLLEHLFVYPTEHAVAWGRQARAVWQPRRNLVLLGVLAEGGDQLVLAHGRAAFDLQVTSAVA
jgi:hypothetical protein